MDPRAAAVTIRGEAEVWLRYDVTAEKLDRTSPARRAPIEASVPQVRAVLATLADTPGRLPLAWAASVEAYRFANSKGGNPSPMEKRECELRMRDVTGWVGLLDTLPLPQDAAPHLSVIRSARHALNAQGSAPEAIAQMRDALRSAAVALTPAPDRQTLVQAKAEGLAEAEAIAARGEAEAEAMKKKAEAYKHYGEAAVVDIVAGTLPQVVAEAARPMGQIEQMTVLSTDGASHAVRNVASTVAQGNEMAKALFGVDLAELVQSFTQARAGGNGTDQPAPAAPPPIDAPMRDGGPAGG